MYLLDTNIVSLFDVRRQPNALPLIDWMRRHDRELFLSVVTLLEIETGLLKLAREGRSKRAAEIEALRVDIETSFGSRILSIDAEVALFTARLAEHARPAVVEIRDLLIAATAQVHRMTVLTRNLRHFAPTGVAHLDPLTTLPPNGSN